MSFRAQYYHNAMWLVFEYSDPEITEKTVIVYPSTEKVELGDNQIGYQYKQFEYGNVPGNQIWCGFGVHWVPFYSARPVDILWDTNRKSWYLSDSDFAIMAWACPTHYAEILPF